MESDVFLVRVRCDTYNHVSYIKEALDGFCMQDTNFPYICTIFDDASTDGEPDVLKNYLQQHFDVEDKSIVRKEETEDYVLIFARNKKNKNCYFAVFLLKYNHYSIKKDKSPYSKEWDNTKYTALCEGDDYWIDPHKLQRQYDYLETHPSFSLCFHPDYRLFNNGEMVKHCPRIKKDIYNTKDVILLDGGLMATGSMLFRSDYWVYGEKRPKFWANAPVGDEPLRLYLSTKGHIGYINEIMSVYRMMSVGSWTSKNLSINFWTKHVAGILKMYSEFGRYTEHHFRFSIFVAKCILGIKYVKGIWQAFVKKLL